MNKIKNNNAGISLLALIITIIVIIILAAVAIGGSFNSVEKAQEAKHVHELSELKYDASISVQNYNNEKILSSTASLKNHLESLNSTTVEEISPNEAYQVSRGSASIVVYADGNMQEMSNNDIDVVKNTVADMVADTSLTKGLTVSTLGYYSIGDEGGAYYEITDTSDTQDLGRIINLNNGLQAKLIIKNKTINAKQFGLLADGITDESDKIQYVVNQTKQEDCERIVFGKGTYLLSKAVLLTSGTYEGKANSKFLLKSVIPGSQNSNKCLFHNGTTAATIKIYNFNIELDAKSNERDHIYLIRLRNTTDSVVDGCNFYTLDTNTCGYCAVDLYSNNINTTINNVKSTFYGADNAYNSQISVRQYAAGGITDNIKISNCRLEKNGVDEVLWVNGWLGKVSNVEISNCEMYDNGTSTSMIWLGANGTDSGLENVKMHGCTVNKNLFRYVMLKIGMAESSTMPGYAKNIQVYDNTFNITSLREDGISEGGAVICVGTTGYTNEQTSDILIKNNTITSTEIMGSIIRDFSYRYITNVDSNIIKVDKYGSVASSGILYNIGTVNNCTITGYDGVSTPIVTSSVFRNCLNVSNCNSDMLVRTFAYNGWAAAQDNFTISNCNISSDNNVFAITMPSTRKINITVDNSTINNVNNLVSVWYSDKSSAYSGLEEKPVHVNFNNCTINRKKVSGDAVATYTP